jgi:hypothetical protein
MKITANILVGILFVAIIGCISGPDKWKQQAKSPEKTFELARQTILKGDMEGLFNLFSLRKKRVTPLAELKNLYATGKDTWLIQYSGAVIKSVGIENNQATLWVRWGTGADDLLFFIFEEGLWRIDTRPEG